MVIANWSLGTRSVIVCIICSNEIHHGVVKQYTLVESHVVVYVKFNFKNIDIYIGIYISDHGNFANKDENVDI